ncbi:hypothetical protein DXG03_002868 [Asterophora parasitica]|uniref:Uncharacterized protein n=1 Tax=Asterophora parasitica TaxID=117018 RepID=A0A9P7GC27_9AGAR|nr:hypothetical protein DXG03_002868 [Asterophora parasitica]
MGNRTPGFSRYSRACPSYRLRRISPVGPGAPARNSHTPAAVHDTLAESPMQAVKETALDNIQRPHCVYVPRTRAPDARSASGTARTISSASDDLHPQHRVVSQSTENTAPWAPGESTKSQSLPPASQPTPNSQQQPLKPEPISGGAVHHESQQTSSNCTINPSDWVKYSRQVPPRNGEPTYLCLWVDKYGGHDVPCRYVAKKQLVKRHVLSKHMHYKYVEAS